LLYESVADEDEGVVFYIGIKGAVALNDTLEVA
jgi:hypothetical protein